MKSLIVSATKKAKFKAYVIVETKKMEVYQNGMTNGIATYHSPETVQDLKYYSDPSELSKEEFFNYHQAS